jgi:ParB-like chromosome segregation protein Spo0J
MDKKKLEIVWMAPEQLTPYVKNSKAHPTEQVDKIAGQIAAFGFDQPIVVDRDRVIIKGHGRREAAIRLGLKEVPVVISTLDEYQAMAARIGDNKVAEAPWDNDMLKFEFGTLEAQGMDLPEVTGFDPSEVETIMKGWESDIDALAKAGSNLDGITSVIKVTCPQDLKHELIEFLRARVDEQGFEGVEIV